MISEVPYISLTINVRPQKTYHGVMPSALGPTFCQIHV